MGKIIVGHTKCRICGLTINEGDKFTGFPAFLPNGHKLWEFSDGVFHQSCFDNWAGNDELVALYQTWKYVRASRPASVKPGEEDRAWYAEAFKNIPPWSALAKRMSGGRQLTMDDLKEIEIELQNSK